MSLKVSPQMVKYIYKYVGASYIGAVFELRNYVTLKCSYPKDFNDPYELFLTVDFREKPGALAFYKEIVGELPQAPVTCFSNEPHVLPMWAHYAENLTGVVIELNQEALEASFPDSRVGSVDYRSRQDPGLTEMLYRAYEIGKWRYLYLLRQGVFSSAYYSKATCWSYEKEQRLLLRRELLRLSTEPIMLVDVPRDCVSAIICGPRVSPVTIEATREKSQLLRANWYHMMIGRSSAEPYFVDADGLVHVYRKGKITRAKHVCESCKDPIASGRAMCSWCEIDESHEADAAERNTFRILAHFGELEGYIKKMDAVTFRRRK
jgi:hypothetical protein